MAKSGESSDADAMAAEGSSSEISSEESLIAPLDIKLVEHAATHPEIVVLQQRIALLKGLEAKINGVRKSNEEPTQELFDEMQQIILPDLRTQPAVKVADKSAFFSEIADKLAGSSKEPWSRA